MKILNPVVLSKKFVRRGLNESEEREENALDAHLSREKKDKKAVGKKSVNQDARKLATAEWEPHPPGDLTGKQRGYLKSLAHHLKPVVQIGQQGITEILIGETRKQLLVHELIKVKWLGLSKDEGDKKEQAREFARKIGAHYVDLTGQILVLYREPEAKYLAPGQSRRIQLPA